MAPKKPATRRTTTTTVEEPSDGGQGDELDAFDRARLEFSGEPGVRLTIYRYEDGETLYLKRVPYDPAAIDEEWIRKKWGSGAYQLRFADEEGSRRWSKVIQIASDVSPADATRERTAASSAESLFIDTIRKQNELMLQAMLARAAAPAPGGGSGNEALVALVQGMQAQNLELLRSAVNRPDVSSTLLQVLERGMAIASETRADAEGGWLAQVARIAREVLPSVAEMARARAMMAPPAIPVAGAGSTSPPALPAGAPPAPSAPGPNGAPPASSPAPSSALDLDELVRSYSPSILEAIQNRAEPEAVADAILDFIPPALYGELEPLTVERAIRVAPALSQHRDYVSKLVASIRESIAGDDDDEPRSAA